MSLSRLSDAVQTYIKDFECAFLELEGVENMSRRTTAFVDSTVERVNDCDLSRLHAGLDSSSSSTETGMTASTLVRSQQVPILVLLGAPGAGKTMILRHVAYTLACCCDNGYDNEDKVAPFRIPLLLNLSEFIRSLRGEQRVSLVDHVVNVGCMGKPVDRDMLLALLEGALKGIRYAGVTLLLDGIDQVTDVPLRHQLHAAILDLVRVYPGTRVIMASRIMGATLFPDQIEIRHHYYSVLPFTDSQRRLFIESVTNNVNQTERLTATISQSCMLSDLSRNPLMLSLLCALNRESNLPTTRANLCQRCADLLIDRCPKDVARQDAS